MNPEDFKNDPIWNYLFGGNFGRDAGNVGRVGGDILSLLGLNPVTAHRNVSQRWGPIDEGFGRGDMGPFNDMALNSMIDVGQGAARFNQTQPFANLLPNNAIFAALQRARPNQRAIPRPLPGGVNPTLGQSSDGLYRPAPGAVKPPASAPYPPTLPPIAQPMKNKRAANTETQRQTPSSKIKAAVNPSEVQRNTPSTALPWGKPNNKPIPSGSGEDGGRKNTARGSEYVIKSGDTLNKIATQLGMKNWKDLVAKNPWISENPDLIMPGQKIVY